MGVLRPVNHYGYIRARGRGAEGAGVYMEVGNEEDEVGNKEEEERLQRGKTESQGSF